MFTPVWDQHLEHPCNMESKEGNGTNVFIDTSGSEKRKKNPESCINASTCITPAHAIYSTALERYVQPIELLGLQAIWRRDAQVPQIFDAMAHSSWAQDLAGNGMTGTVAQAVVLAALSTSDAFLHIARDDIEPDPPSSAGSAIPLCDAVVSAFESECQPSRVVGMGEGRNKATKRKQPDQEEQHDQEETHALVPSRRIRGKQSSSKQSFMKLVIPKKRKQGVGSGNKKAGGKSAMISIFQKEIICKKFDELKAQGEKYPGKKMAKMNLRGYYAGCTLPSKWGRVREEQQWSLLCATAPALCKAKKELPNCLRRVINFPKLKHGNNEVSAVKTCMPFILKQIVEEVVMERIDNGEEVGIPFVKNTILWCTNIWNECVSTIRDMIHSQNLSMLKKEDDRLARMNDEELNEVFKSVNRRAEDVLVPVVLAKSDDALQILVLIMQVDVCSFLISVF